jgi:hypothetical protein
MMPKPRSAKAAAPEPPPYQPSGLARPTEGEARNGWTPDTLTEYLRAQTGDDHAFHCELLRRAQEFLRLCREVVAMAQRAGDTGQAQQRLAMARQDLEQAQADVAYWTEKLAEVEAAIRAPN